MPLRVLLLILALGAAPLSTRADQTGAAILLYHRLGSAVTDSMTVTTSTFEEQLGWLRDHGYRIVPLRDVAEGREPPKSVAIAVDDGHRSVYTELLPILRRERFPVTLFIYPSAISNASYALTWEQIAELQATGLVDVQSHTFWHPNFNHERARRPAEDYRRFVLDQLVRSKAILEKHCGGKVDMLAWPFGIHDPELEKWAADAGYVAAFTLDRRRVTADSAAMALPRFLMTDADRGARMSAVLGETGRSR